jgi:hypothetical protein
LDYFGLPWITLDYLGLLWITLDYSGFGRVRFGRFFQPSAFSSPPFAPLQHFKEQLPSAVIGPFSRFSFQLSAFSPQPSFSTLSCFDSNASGDIQQTSTIFSAEEVFGPNACVQDPVTGTMTAPAK